MRWPPPTTIHLTPKPGVSGVILMPHDSRETLCRQPGWQLIAPSTDFNLRLESTDHHMKNMAILEWEPLGQALKLAGHSPNILCNGLYLDERGKICFCPPYTELIDTRNHMLLYPCGNRETNKIIRLISQQSSRLDLLLLEEHLDECTALFAEYQSAPPRSSKNHQRSKSVIIRELARLTRKQA